MPGPTGSPVARSHTIVDARWFVMPTASTGPPSSSAAVAHSSGGVGHRAGVELDEAGRRRRRQQLPVVHVFDGRVRADDRGAQPARPDVDHEDAALAHELTLGVASFRDEAADHADAKPSAAG